MSPVAVCTLCLAAIAVGLPVLAIVVSIIAACMRSSQISQQRGE